MAPPTGQVQSPSTSTSRTPGDSSQRSTFSVSSAVADGTGPGVPGGSGTVSAVARSCSTKVAASAPGGMTPAAASRP